MMSLMSFTITWETRTAPGSSVAHTAIDALRMAQAAIAAGGLRSITDSSGAEITFEALKTMATTSASTRP